MRRLVLLAVVAPVLIGCGSATKPAQTVTVKATTATTSATRTQAAYLPNECTNQVERPSSFVVTCADGGSGAEQLHWKSWGDPVAQATGFAYANDCEPDCVEGGVHHSQAEMYVSRLRRCEGKLQYTYAVIITDSGGYAARMTGAYNVACAGPKSAGVSSTEPGQEPETVVAPNAPSDREVREVLRQAKEKEQAAK